MSIELEPVSARTVVHIIDKTIIPIIQDIVTIIDTSHFFKDRNVYMQVVVCIVGQFCPGIESSHI